MFKTKLGRTLSTISIIGAFLLAFLVILLLFRQIKPSRALIDFMIITWIACLGCSSSTVLVKFIEISKKKTALYISLGLTAITCLLWIIFIFVGQNVIFALIERDKSYDFDSAWNYTLICFIITIQTLCTVVVVNYIYTFKKKMLLLQVITYISVLYVDIWLTLFILNINSSSDFADAFLFHSRTIMFVVIAFTFVFISATFYRRTLKELMIVHVINNQNNPGETILHKNIKPEYIKETKNSIEDRLNTLNDLFNKGIISEESYLNKKEEILNDI